MITPSELQLPVNEWREGQLESIMNSLSSNKRFVAHNQPTGAGKSVVLVAESRIRNIRTLILTSSKQLQDQYCVSPATRILTSDLRWVMAETLNVGDLLVGFDEMLSPIRRRWRSTVVVAIQKVIRPTYRLTLSDGTVLISSEEHRWLVGRTGHWLETGQLRSDSRLLRLLDVWEPVADYDSGYLAAMFDGEGHLHQSTGPNGADVNLSMAQKPNQALAYVEEALTHKGYSYKVYKSEDCYRLQLSSRKEAIRFLGQFRPKRLLPKLDLDKLGTVNPAKPVSILSKEYIGEQELLGIETSTGTFVAEGFASHNSKAFKHLGLVDVRGKSNYNCIATELGGEFYDGTAAKTVEHGPCHYGAECALKLDGCTYYDRLRQAGRAKLVLANYAAWISANMYTDGWGYFPLVMCDEAHEAEEWLARMIAIRLPKVYGQAMEIQYPDTEDPIIWASWAMDMLPNVRAEIKSTQGRLLGGKRSATKSLALLQALQNFERILDRLRKVSGEWLVLPERHATTFHPVWVHQYAESYLFAGASKVVLASATIRPHTLNLLGIANGEFDFFDYPSTFPVDRRPIYYYPVVKMHYGMDEEDTLEWINVLDSFIGQRLDRKGIIHTVSFARQQELLDHSQYKHLMVANLQSTTGGYTSTLGTLQKFRAMKPPAILVTPSMGVGVDLKYGDCEYTIIPKMPFENTNDPVAQARANEDPEHAVFKAGEKLAQSIGRAMRAPDDRNETLITDTMFNLYRGIYHSMIPKWLWDAVVKIDSLPPPAPKL